MARPSIRELEPADVQETAALLAQAMDDDPAYGFLFPAGEKRRGLTDLFARNLRTHLPYRCTSVLAEDGHIVGTVTLRPPGGIPISLLTMLRRGLIPFAAAHGLGAVRRLFALKRVYDDLEEAMVAGAPHWLVHMMAVTPAQQGRGLGSRLVGEVLGARTPGLASRPTVLTTHQERNVTFYRRAGFDVTQVRDVALGDPYRVWCMQRP